MTRKKKIPTLSEIIKCLPEDILQLNSALIKNTSFLEKQIEILTKHIEENGVSEAFHNGTKQTAETATFLQFQKQYAVNIKYLTDLVVKNSSGSGDELLDFLNQ